MRAALRSRVSRASTTPGRGRRLHCPHDQRSPPSRRGAREPARRPPRRDAHGPSGTPGGPPPGSARDRRPPRAADAPGPDERNRVDPGRDRSPSRSRVAATGSTAPRSDPHVGPGRTVCSPGCSAPGRRFSRPPTPRWLMTNSTRPRDEIAESPAVGLPTWPRPARLGSVPVTRRSADRPTMISERPTGRASSPDSNRSMATSMLSTVASIVDARL